MQYEPSLLNREGRTTLILILTKCNNSKPAGIRVPSRKCHDELRMSWKTCWQQSSALPYLSVANHRGFEFGVWAIGKYRIPLKGSVRFLYRELWGCFKGNYRVPVKGIPFTGNDWNLESRGGQAIALPIQEVETEVCLDSHRYTQRISPSPALDGKYRWSA